MDFPNWQRIQEYLVARRADQFAFLSALVKTRSENPPTVSEPIREKIVELLQGFELSPDVLEVPEEVAGPHGYEDLANVIVRREFGDGPVLAMSAHADTAPAGPRWNRDPFGAGVESGRMYGRGVSDGKGDLAAYLFAMLALEEVEDQLSGAVELHITFDGMTGGELGEKWLISEGKTTPTWAIVPGVSHALGTSATGVLNLDVEIRGQGAPASQPHLASDALEGTSHVLSALYAHRATLGERRSEVLGIGSPTLVVTNIAGGSGPLAVPDMVTMSLDRRVLPDENPDEVEAEITNIIGRAVVRVPGVVCTVRRLRLSPSMVANEGTALLANSFKAHVSQRTETETPEYGVSVETPARHFTAAGIPAFLYGAGPILDEQSSSSAPDESLVLDDLRIATEVLVAVAADWLRKP